MRKAKPKHLTSLLLIATSWLATAVVRVLAADPVVSKEVPAHTSALFAQADGPPPLAIPTTMAEPTPPPAPATKEAAPTPSQNVTINLINRLVQKGILSHQEAAELIKQAEDDAVAARAQAVGQAPEDDGAVRVTYIPENVKAEIRDQLRQEVMTQAKDEGWASPNKYPEWTSRIKLFGDIRVRYRGDFYPAGNDNTGAFPIFNTINTGAPFDVSGTQFSPQYNVDQNRQRMQLRARIGADIDLSDGFTAGLRLATGQDNSPVTTDQTQGVANQGQGGDFGKFAVWIDRAFIKYEAGGQPNKNLSLLFGRFDNPFFNTSQIMWDDDVGFDGVAIQAKYQVCEGVTPFLTVGAFPVFNTDLNFSTIQPSKFKSEDKWLYAAQFGINLKLSKEINAKLAAAYYDFKHIEGRLSDPYTPLTAQDAGNTDNTRPSFAQRGNTYMALRNIIPSAINNFGTTQQFQYFGLATPFQVLAYNARIDFNHFEPLQISLLGEYAKNLAFNKSAIDANAVNNRGPNNADGSVGSFAGGDTAWNIALQFGKSTFEKAGDWNASIGYRYVESDAVVDGFVDNDFGGGGTNLKGYTIGAAVALSPGIKLGLRWMGADSIAGPPFKSDVFMIDLNAKF